MPRITEVVKHLIIINVILYLGTFLLLGEPSGSTSLSLINNPDGSRFMEWDRNILAVFFPTSVYFQPYQIVTHMFMHGSFMHILFNMYGLYLFGTAIEALWGPKRFLFYYFFTGFGALALHGTIQYFEIKSGAVSPYAANVPMLGASGAVFGLLAGFGMLYPNQVISLLFPPISLKAKYFVLIYGGIELFLGVSGYQVGVAHFAHVGGAVFGALLILYWRKFGTNL